VRRWYGCHLAANSGGHPHKDRGGDQRTETSCVSTTRPTPLRSVALASSTCRFVMRRHHSNVATPCLGMRLRTRPVHTIATAERPTATYPRPGSLHGRVSDDRDVAAARRIFVLGSLDGPNCLAVRRRSADHRLRRRVLLVDRRRSTQRLIGRPTRQHCDAGLSAAAKVSLRPPGTAVRPPNSLRLWIRSPCAE
jgi:hypothetical protein